MPNNYRLSLNAANLAELDLAMLEVEALGTLRPQYLIGGYLMFIENEYQELNLVLPYIAMADKANDVTSNREFDTRWLAMRKTKPPALPDHSTHFLWPFEGKMLPKIARALINICLGQRRDGIVYDPFCGSGTVLLEANLMGAPAIGCDVDPFASWLTHVKTHPDASFFDQSIMKLNYPTGDARRAVMKEARAKCPPNASANVQVYNESCLARTFHNVSAIVTSPPYYDAIDYIERHYEMRASFNLPNPQSQSLGVGCTIDEYHRQVDQFGVMVANTLGPGGRTAIVLADHAGVPVVMWHEMALKANGLQHVAKIIRPYVNPTRGIDSDVIMIYEKPV